MYIPSVRLQPTLLCFQLKVIVVGHRDAGKSELIKCLSSMPSGEPEPPEVPRTPRPDVPPVEGSDRQTFQTTFVSNPQTNLENIQGSRPTRPSANTPPLARRPYSGGVRQVRVDIVRELVRVLYRVCSVLYY